MAWRLRRRKKILPGLTLNLSEKGFGMSLGGPAGRVSISPTKRITVGQSIPGTGLYRSQVISTGKRKGKAPPAADVKKRGGCGRWLLYGFIGFVALMACSVFTNIVSPRTEQEEQPARSAAVALPTWTATPEPQASYTPTSAPTATELIAVAPVPTDTAVPPTFTPAPTFTLVPTDVPAATATPVPTSVPAPAGPVANSQANVREGPGTDYAVVTAAQPGQTMVVTGMDSSGEWLQLASGYWIASSLVDNVPAGLPVTAVAAQLPGGNPTTAPTPPAQSAAPTPSWQREERGILFTSDCPCDQGDALNCGDFGIDMDAQACYMRCMDLAGRDVHGMDRDKDGTACEWSW